jgi:hypothetical protein
MCSRFYSISWKFSTPRSESCKFEGAALGVLGAPPKAKIRTGPRFINRCPALRFTLSAFGLSPRPGAALRVEQWFGVIFRRGRRSATSEILRRWKWCVRSRWSLRQTSSDRVQCVGYGGLPRNPRPVTSREPVPQGPNPPVHAFDHIGFFRKVRGSRIPGLTGISLSLHEGEDPPKNAARDDHRVENILVTPP